MKKLEDDKDRAIQNEWLHGHVTSSKKSGNQPQKGSENLTNTLTDSEIHMRDRIAVRREIQNMRKCAVTAICSV